MLSEAATCADEGISRIVGGHPAPMRYALLLVTAAILSLALTPAVARLARRVGAIDVPAGRKLHRGPIRGSAAWRSPWRER